MKKLLLGTLLLLILVGCMDPTNSPTLQSQISSAADRTEEQPEKGFAEEYKNKQEEQNDESAVERVGLRKTPAKIGDVVKGRLDSAIYGQAVMEVELLEVIRGEKAWEIIQSANQFNDVPRDGKEYLLAKFRVKQIEDLSGTDQKAEISTSQFSYSTSDYKISDDFVSVAGVEPSLDCEI